MVCLKIRSQKIFKVGLTIFLGLVALGIGSLITSCRPSAEPIIVHARLGQTDFYIPKAYLDFGHTSAGPESALMQAWYPGSAIVPEKSQMDLVKEGVWWKNVRILFGTLPNTAPSFDHVARTMIGHFNATRFVTEEYGLQHYAPPPEPGKDSYDVWIEVEQGQIRSYITCTEKDSEVSVPKCAYHARYKEKFSLKISFDRRVLSEWKLIKTNVNEMLESFHSLQTSSDYIKKISKQNN